MAEAERNGIRPVSWSAVAAGVLTALSLQLLLALLAATIALFAREAKLPAVAISAGLLALAVPFFALLFGGALAARLGAAPRHHFARYGLLVFAGVAVLVLLGGPLGLGALLAMFMEDEGTRSLMRATGASSLGRAPAAAALLLVSTLLGLGGALLGARLGRRPREAIRRPEGRRRVVLEPGLGLIAEEPAPPRRRRAPVAAGPVRRRHYAGYQPEPPLPPPPIAEPLLRRREHPAPGTVH